VFAGLGLEDVDVGEVGDYASPRSCSFKNFGSTSFSSGRVRPTGDGGTATLRAVNPSSQSRVCLFHTSLHLTMRFADYNDYHPCDLEHC
jgi:hypothetical protein